MATATRYVRAQPRKDGSDRVVFFVPQTHRPKQWPKTISLPEDGTRGSMTDPVFAACVNADAESLNDSLDRQIALERRISDVEKDKIADMCEYYYDTDQFNNQTPVTQKRNRKYCEKIIEWAHEMGNPPIQQIPGPLIQRYLNRFRNTPHTRYRLQGILFNIFKQAVLARLIQSNLVTELGWNPPKNKPKSLWFDEDIDRHIEVCHRLRQPGLAALIQVAYVIGQRLTDLRELQYSISYRETGLFGITQRKTGAFVPIPIPNDLVALIESVRVRGSQHLFNDAETGLPFDHTTLRARFLEVQSLASTVGKPKLHLRTLWHSCICRMLRANVSIHDVASVTGHKLNTVYQIMEHYAVRSDEAARRAIVKTHLHNGGSEDDFADNANEVIMWNAEQSGVELFELPKLVGDDYETLFKRLGIRLSHVYSALAPAMLVERANGSVAVAEKKTPAAA